MFFLIVLFSDAFPDILHYREKVWRYYIIFAVRFSIITAVETLAPTINNNCDIGNGMPLQCIFAPKTRVAFALKPAMVFALKGREVWGWSEARERYS